MSSIVNPASAAGKALYDGAAMIPLKNLRNDGSITAPDKSGVQVLPPSPERAALYAKAPATALRYLFTDGSVHDMEIGGGGGTGGATSTTQLSVANPALESVAGTATSQAGINAENAEQIKSLWVAENTLDGKVNSLQFVSGSSFNKATEVLTLTNRDGTTVVIDIDAAIIEQLEAHHIGSLVEDVTYDESTEEIVFIKEGGAEVRIPIATMLSDVFATQDDLAQGLAEKANQTDLSALNSTVTSQGQSINTLGTNLTDLNGVVSTLNQMVNNDMAHKHTMPGTNQIVDLPALFSFMDGTTNKSAAIVAETDAQGNLTFRAGSESGNVIGFTDRILDVSPDQATIRFYHSGDASALEVIDDETLLAFIIVSIISETQRRNYSGWEPELLQELCKAFHEARVTGVDISGTLSGQHLMANIENIAASYSEDIVLNNEIVGDYTMPSLQRNLQANTAAVRIYAVEDSQQTSGYSIFTDVVFGGGTFQSRFTAVSLSEIVPAGESVDLFAVMGNQMQTIVRGLQDMDFDVDVTTGIVKFPSVQEFIPYDIDIRIGGEAGASGIHAFKINLVRVQDNSVARSYKSLYVDTDILANESILGLSYTDGTSDPYILDGMRFVLQNSAAGEELTITGIDITIQGTRS